MKISVIYRIYDIRMKKSLSLRELSTLSGISKSEINFIENGKKHPSVYTLCCLAVALQMLPEDLFVLIVEDCPL